MAGAEWILRLAEAGESDDRVRTPARGAGSALRDVPPVDVLGVAQGRPPGHSGAHLRRPSLHLGLPLPPSLAVARFRQRTPAGVVASPLGRADRPRRPVLRVDARWPVRGARPSPRGDGQPCLEPHRGHGHRPRCPLARGTAFVRSGVPAIPRHAWGIVVWLAVGNTAFAFTLWNRTLRTLSAMESSIVNDTMIIQILVLAVLFLEESLSGREILDLAIVVVGTLPVHLRRCRTSTLRGGFAGRGRRLRVARTEGSIRGHSLLALRASRRPVARRASRSPRTHRHARG